MKACLDISAGLAQSAGIGRYARQLALALQERASQSGLALSLFHNHQANNRLPVALEALPRSTAPLRNKAWRLFIMGGLPMPGSWRGAIDGCDLFHGTDVIAPRLNIPTLITIHDLTTYRFPQHHSLFNRLYLRWALPVMARRSQAIIADSYATQQDIVAFLDVPDAKVTAIHLGVDASFFSLREPAIIDADLATLGIRTPFLLAVGTLEPRKNLLTLLRAYSTLPPSVPPLLLVGKHGWGKTSLIDAIAQLGIKDRVHITGYVPDAVLPSLYNAAEIFVYPSLYEGFGLPVLEAMACGAPVITSNVSSLPEVAGNAAVQVDPSRADDLAEAIRTLLESPDMRTRMRQAGIERSQCFTWDKCAQETLDVYHRVLEAAR